MATIVCLGSAYQAKLLSGTFPCVGYSGTCYEYERSSTAPIAMTGFYGERGIVTGWGANVEAGEACASGSLNVIMTSADYDLVRGTFTGFNLEDVAAILPAVALVWAVAWLFKRLRAVLVNRL